MFLAIGVNDSPTFTWISAMSQIICDHQLTEEADSDLPRYISLRKIDVPTNMHHYYI